MDKKDLVYKSVLIVGNGFDINLGLRTSYSDYLKSDLFNNLCEINSLAKSLKFKNKIYNWIDVEKELYNLSHGMFYLRGNILKPRVERQKSIISFESNYRQICESLREYLCEEDVAAIKNLDSKMAFKILKEALNNDSYILTFNYTGTIERICEHWFRNIELNINHIHGSLSSQGFVFGVEDSAELSREHVFLYKSYNEKQNINGLTSIFENADSFTFFGYSLGETDHSYFRDFFKSQTKFGCKVKNFTFYYYGKDAYDDLIWQLQKLTDNHLSDLKKYNNIEFVDVKIEEESRQC